MEEEPSELRVALRFRMKMEEVPELEPGLRLEALAMEEAATWEPPLVVSSKTSGP